MSTHNTPFIPPLGTPSPDPVHAPVIPLSNSSSSSQSRSGSSASSSAMPPQAAWPGSPFGGQPQYPYFGAGTGTPYGQPFIPFSPYGVSQPPHSAGPGAYTPLPPQGPGGLSVDYTGYPDLPPTPMMGTPGGGASIHAPPIPQSTHGTPWHGVSGAMPPHHGLGAGGPPPGTPWQGPPVGHPPGFGARGAWGGGLGGPQFNAGMFPGAGWPGAGGFSPDPGWGVGGGGGGGWGPGGGGGAPWPGVHPGVHPGVQPPVPEPPRRFNREAGDRMPKWTAGSHYGPVLDPFQLRVVGARLELNPLLTPVQDEEDKVFLRWNMLMGSSLVHRSCDPLQVSWSGGRNEPATFPRLSHLKIVSEHYPWLVEIKARDEDAGVTCGEVIDCIASSMEKLTSKTDYDALPSGLKRVVLEAYRYNRSRHPNVPGGKMGEGLKRVDFLGEMTAFGGLEVDEAAVGKVCKVVVPGYVVLKCARKEPLTMEEVRGQDARARAASQAARSRSASRRSASARGSITGSTTSGIGVDIELPSDEEYSSDETH